MPNCMTTLIFAAVSAVAFAGTALPAGAASSTSRGQISVAQVVEMLQQSPGNRLAQQVLTAYLAGVGETVGLVTSMGNVSCEGTVGLDSASVSAALQAVASGPDAAETAATPLIVQDVLDRAGCKI